LGIVRGERGKDVLGIKTGRGGKSGDPRHGQREGIERAGSIEVRSQL